MVNARSGRPKLLTMLAFAGTASVLGACEPNLPEIIAYMPPTIYCYETLAKPDCYAQPLPGEYNRMIGFYGPQPAEMPLQQPLEWTTTGPASNN
jgi:hypothetical protein